VIRVNGSRITIEDLDSTNGTWVNGVRISRAELHHDDWIQLGSFLLTLEKVDSDELELGLEVDTAPAPVTGEGRHGSTGMALRAEYSGVWLAALNGLCRLLFDAQAPNLPAAILTLVQKLDATAGGFFESDRGDTWVVKALAGPLDLLGDPATLQSSWDQQSRSVQLFDGAMTGIVAAHPTRLAVLRELPSGRSQTLVLAGAGLEADGLPPLAIALRVLSGVASLQKREDCSPPPHAPGELSFPSDHVPGLSRAFQEVYKQVQGVVGSTIPVLIAGETGTGKEHIVHMIHHSSPRASAPLEVVNCAAIPADLLEAELFGIERGVATGVEARQGKFLAAHGGTLFFDEVGEMPASLQAKLLRAVQDGEIHPLGARRRISVDVRIVSATNADLREKMEAGLFRPDLFFRLAGCEIHVPALRERPEDIPGLVEHFVHRFAREHGKRIRGVSVRALKLLQNAPWPGNVRQLEHELRRLVIVCPNGGAIESSMLSPDLLRTATATPSTAPPASPREPDPGDSHLKSRVNALERDLITEAISDSNGNLAEAARRLGISRNGLVLKMKRLGLQQGQENGPGAA